VKILFLCVANSARSQMAEGLARSLFKRNVLVASAGSEPSRVNPFAIKAMKKIGVDISNHHSKSISDAMTKDADFVITLCADEVCPIVHGPTQKKHWPFSDPANVQGTEEDIFTCFEAIRDQIREKLLRFGRDHSLLEVDS